ncbi:MAG: energy transducer TonB [Prevotellaceae bacterium]|jgi:TonB family protein|nr:energy transducer TonB [Prevotellaceae bacterium]
MKKIFVFLFLFLFVICSYAQSIVCSEGKIELKRDSTDNISNWTSDIAIYPLKFEYPTIAKEKGIQGLVLVGFDVDDNCQIKKVKIIKGLGYGLDEIALELATCLQRELDKKDKKDCFEWKGLSYPVRFVLR